jgi:hypothetical protein
VTKRNSDGRVLVRFAYTRGAAGNPIAIEREPALGVFYYAYDRLQRLRYEGQFVSAARQYENYYEFDAAGNRALLRHGETGAENSACERSEQTSRDPEGGVPKGGDAEGAHNLTYYDYNAANELTQLHDKVTDARKPRPGRSDHAQELWRRSDGWTYSANDANGSLLCRSRRRRMALVTKAEIPSWGRRRSTRGTTTGMAPSTALGTSARCSWASATLKAKRVRACSWLALEHA